MDTRRGAIVVGASLAALAAGWYIRRWYVTREIESEAESERLVDRFDERMEQMNQVRKKFSRPSNGRSKTARA